MTPAADSVKGMFAAASIIGLWTVSLVFWLSVDLAQVPIVLVVAGALVQTFLHTGLFITAHDAMHGTVFPLNRRVNDAVGQLAVRLYALFSFRKLRTKHHAHHAHPVSGEDPDFHDDGSTRMWPWYLRFMREYLGLGQLVGMAVAFNVLQHLVGVAPVNLIAMWVAPALLSSLQLFYFGTYLPHRRPPEGYDDAHRATSSGFRPWLSFLTCYHFGYHWEHHESPHVPWWRLPSRRARSHRTTRRGDIFAET